MKKARKKGPPFSAFENRVKRQIQRLRRTALGTIEAEVSRKRVAWYGRKHPYTGKSGRPTPRDAYELLLLEYLGLAEEQVPVVAETDREITWLSANRCPTLEACRELDLDTREVCRRVYEKSSQHLLSQLDPQLRFWRDYEEIRPRAPHCREGIVRVDFEEMMRLAIQEARISLSEGGDGSGAVIVLRDQIVGKAHDTTMTDNRSSHAEFSALRQAVGALGDEDLCGAILFTTREPCPMCTSSAIRANLTSIVYGKSRPLDGCREIVERSPATVEVIADVLGNECRALYA